MSQQFRCTIGDERATFDSKHAAAQAGWSFVEITTKGTVRYHVCCPEHRPAWLVQALRMPKEPREMKETKE
jgi:hypothetical protein